jgi:hypothetical protein
MTFSGLQSKEYTGAKRIIQPILELGMISWHTLTAMELATN